MLLIPPAPLRLHPVGTAFRVVLPAEVVGRDIKTPAVISQSHPASSCRVWASIHPVLRTRHSQRGSNCYPGYSLVGAGREVAGVGKACSGGLGRDDDALFHNSIRPDFFPLTRCVTCGELASDGVAYEGVRANLGSSNDAGEMRRGCLWDSNAGIGAWAGSVWYRACAFACCRLTAFIRSRS